MILVTAQTDNGEDWDMKVLLKLAAISLLSTTGNVAAQAQSGASTQSSAAPAPKRVNRVIELLESGQPVYYTGASGGFEEGLKMADTEADYINYNMEHGSFDVQRLREFMAGLVVGGPTRTGHRTVPVIATIPQLGDDGEAMRANSWAVQQALATGIHGILLTQVEDPEAVRLFVEAARYPFAPGADPAETHRGSGSQSYAAQVWGVEPNEYVRIADTWPLNPEGEIFLGLKIENPKATANVEQSAAVPGVGFVEWGPGDQAYYLLGAPAASGGDRDDHPAMVQTRARVLAAAKANNIYFLNSCSVDTVIEQIEDGTMICTGGDSPAADIGRKHTNRPQPW